jgi:hypothetical protein
LVKKKAVRGDKLRDAILYVYLHTEFSKDKIKVADLKKTVGYGSGGAYSAFESRYLEKINDEIRLTEEGIDYVKSRILPKFDIYKSYGNVIITISVFFFVQWLEWTYLNVAIIPGWYFALMLLILGIFLRFFVLRFDFFVMKKRKKMERF